MLPKRTGTNPNIFNIFYYNTAKAEVLTDDINDEIDQVQEDIDDHSQQLQTIEQELQTLSESGSIIGMLKYATKCICASSSSV